MCKIVKIHLAGWIVGLFAVVSLMPPVALGQDCVPDVFCLEAVQEDHVVDLYLESLAPFAISVEIDVELENASTDAALPLVSTYPPGQRTMVLRLRHEDHARPVRYTYRSRWDYGVLLAQPNLDATYALPYAPGQSFKVIQGYNGRFSHRNRQAIDWAMPERTPVHAARAGMVVDFEDSHNDGGLDDRFRDRANFILILHGDGTLALYAHLAKNGVFVRTGQRVREGQPIGVSGNTGFSGSPHLHFEVYALAPGLKRETIPVRFRIGPSVAEPLTAGRAYRAPLR